MPTARPQWFSIIAPGILLAATGVGAGDLLTASLAGSEAGLSLLWAVLAGCILKWTLSEGIARWQLATNTTLLEGWIWRLGNWIQWVFIAYLGLFTLVVGGALMSACGVAASGFFLLGEPATSKIIWGALHSLAGYVLVRYGSFRLFEWLMSVFIGIMFVTVILTAVLIQPDWTAVARGLIPSIPATGDAQWLLAVMGGVGGTVTLLSYGYWIREKGRHGLDDVRICRLDLTAGYVVTALFGLAVMIIGSRVEITNQGATLALDLAQQLGHILGAPGRWLFLAGFLGRCLFEPARRLAEPALSFRRLHGSSIPSPRPARAANTIWRRPRPIAGFCSPSPLCRLSSCSRRSARSSLPSASSARYFCPCSRSRC